MGEETERKTKFQSKIKPKKKVISRKLYIGMIILIVILAGYITASEVAQSFGAIDTINFNNTEAKNNIAIGNMNINLTSNQTINEWIKTKCQAEGERAWYLILMEKFFTTIMNIDRPLYIKFLIFIGIIYLIQVVFMLAMDVIEVIILCFAIIKRIYVWIRSKTIPIKPKEPWKQNDYWEVNKT
jgi:hypothetical protein